MKQLLIIAFCFVTSLSWSQDWRDALDQARTLYKEKNYDKAYSAYLIALKGAPKNISLDAEVAQAAYKAKDYQSAVMLYQNLQANNTSEKVILTRNLGNCYFHLKNYDAAIEAYKEVLRNDPNDNDTRYNLALAMKRQRKKPKQEPKSKPENKPVSNSKDKLKKSNKDKADSTIVTIGKNTISTDKTDRMLDDLMKKEMNTKKNLNKANAASNEMNNGKDW